MSELYEIIIFSDENISEIQEILRLIDPHQTIVTEFFGRDSMVMSNWKYIKDLQYLNRDLNELIIVDKNITTFRKNKENALIVCARI